MVFAYGIVLASVMVSWIYGVSLFNVLEEEVLMVYIFSHANFYGTKVNLGSNL